MTTAQGASSGSTGRIAIVVGINAYRHDALAFAVNDAEEMAEVLGSKEYGFEIVPLLDHEATRAAIIDALEEARTRQPESIVFYFSGHGYTTSWGDTYIATSDADRADEGVDIATLTRMMETASLTCQASITILDCCHSGAIVKWHSATPLNLDSVRKNTRSAIQSAVFSACRPDEKAYSAVASSHGAFTHYLLEGATGAAVAPDGHITLEDLVSYVRRHLDAGIQSTAFSGDSLGRYILGSNLTSSRPDPPSRQRLEEISARAGQLVEQFESDFRSANVSWSTSGLDEASHALRPVVDWFERQSSKYPELSEQAPFKAHRNRLLSRAEQVQHLSIGQQLDGYMVKEKLGKGGFGTVWLLGREEQGGTAQLAFKVLKSEHLDEPNMLRLFDRGYKAMERLNHNRVVKVRGYKTAPRGFLMDFIPSRNARSVGPTASDSPLQAVRLINLVADTIEHAHLRGVIHRDIKPENLLLRYTESGAWLPYLTDFDLAWFSTASTVVAEALAPLPYGAPEYLHAPNSQAARRPTVDVFGFAQLSLFLITGSDPVYMRADLNDKTMRNWLNYWDNPGASEAMYDLYRRSVQDRYQDRPQEFSFVRERLADIEGMLLDDSLEVLSERTFLKFLYHGIAGMPGEENPAMPTMFWSVSGRTSLSISIEGASRDAGMTYLDVRAELSLQELQIAGLNSAKARARLNHRVDGVLAKHQNVSGSFGQRGAYSRIFRLPAISANSDGVRAVRAVLHEILSTIEGA